MGKAADKTFLQSRILNRGKGPAVHSLRAQIDRVEYHKLMKKTIEDTDGLYPVSYTHLTLPTKA